MANKVNDDKSPTNATPEPWFGAIMRDVRVRAPLYLSDWTIESMDEFNKIVAATLFAYFTSVLPAVIFGDQLQLETDNKFGLSEVLVSTGGMGILYSLFAGQGLVIVGVTGPVVFFTLTVWTLAKAINAPFLQLNAWVNIWCGLMHIFVAAGGYTKLVQKVTAFSGEVFGFFISVAYLFLGFRNIVDLFPTDLKGDDDGNSVAVHLASAFASVVFAGVMYSLAISFHHAQNWRIMNGFARWFVSSFGMVLAIVLCTALSYTPVCDNDHIALQRLAVPSGAGGGPVPSDGRNSDSWFLDLMGSDTDGNKMNVGHVFVALFPALMLLVLFFFDHNVSSILAQDAKFNLVKPPSFDYDFAVLGALLVLCGIIGVPPGNGLIPQAPLHVRALAMIEYEETPGGKREVYKGVVEKRWSNLLQSLGCFLTVFLFPVIKTIPQSVLSGTFLYMGMSGFYGNGLYDRLGCLFMEAERRPDFDFIKHVPFPQMTRWTLLQFFSVALIFFVSFNFFMPEGSAPIAVLFPVIIAILIPLREKWLPTKFTVEEIKYLDPSGGDAEDNAEKEAAYDRTKPPVAPNEVHKADHFTPIPTDEAGEEASSPSANVEEPVRSSA